jgi:hypothetical protein
VRTSAVEPRLGAADVSGMGVVSRLAPVLLVVLPLAGAAPASAAKVTLGSNLSAPAAAGIGDTALIEAHGQDSAFWPVSGSMPEDGQILSVTVKGTVFREKGAADPANLIHLQTLMPAAADGSRQVWLSSGAFYLPIDRPNAVTTFTPENLCVKQGGTVAFNDIGGFAWGGALGAPLDPAHYQQGAPFGVFGAVRGSSTARFSGDNVTNNGDTLTVTGANESGPGGTVRAGEELLMRYVVATGDDRSEPCGGPRRHPDGRLVDTTKPTAYMKVADVHGKAQRPYVTRDRRFQTGVYCGPVSDCAGRATIRIGKRVLATAPFSVRSMSSGRVPMRLRPADFRRLDRSRARTLRVTYVLSTAFGTYSKRLTLKR